MNKFYSILLLMLSLFVEGWQKPVLREKLPNLVIIFMDDLGYGDLSCYGALDYKTPQLDQLAAEGIRFTNFLCAQPVCTASRVGLLTGCYPNRLSMRGALSPNSKVGIHPDETTLAELLKQKNYTTGIFGKWHLGDHQQFLPLQHGFDEYFGIPFSNDMWPVWYDGKPATPEQKVKAQYPTLGLWEGNQKIEELTTLEDQSLLTKRLTERAVAFIQKNKKRPFFLYLPHSMPHVPLGASSAFKGKSKQGLYGDVMLEMDWSVGQIMQTLKTNGLDKNTLVIFTSDNGPWYNYGNHAGSNAGLREGKGTPFEGGLRVPCIMRWPGQVPAGVICNQLSSTLDILPTIADLCKIPLPTKKIDGQSMLPVLKGNTEYEVRKTFYYYYNRNDLQAVRSGHWKLILPYKGRSYLHQLPGEDGFPGVAPEDVSFPMGLYDLRRDPGEAYDVQKKYPEIVKELLEIAEQARADLGDDLTQRPRTNVRPSGTVE